MREIRRSWTVRWDTTFLNHPVRYGVLHPRRRYVVLRPRGEMRRSWTAQCDTTFIVRAARSVVLQPLGGIRRSSAGRRDPTFCRSAVDIRFFYQLRNTINVKLASIYVQKGTKQIQQVPQVTISIYVYKEQQLYLMYLDIVTHVLYLSPVPYCV